MLHLVAVLQLLTWYHPSILHLVTQQCCGLYASNTFLSAYQSDCCWSCPCLSINSILLTLAPMFLPVLRHRYFHLCSVQNSWDSSVTNCDIIMKSCGTFNTNAKSQTLLCGFLLAAGEWFIGLLPETQSCTSFFVTKTAREEGQRASELLMWAGLPSDWKCGDCSITFPKKQPDQPLLEWD